MPKGLHSVRLTPYVFDVIYANLVAKRQAVYHQREFVLSRIVQRVLKLVFVQPLASPLSAIRPFRTVAPQRREWSLLQERKGSNKRSKVSQRYN